MTSHKRLSPAHFAQNIALMEEYHQVYLTDPAFLDASWKAFFAGVEFGQSGQGGLFSKEVRVKDLIHAYRSFGHLFASVNPIALHEKKLPVELQLDTLGFKEEELNENFPTQGLLEEKEAPLEKIIDRLQKIYSGSIGIEYMHISNREVHKMIEEAIERYHFQSHFNLEKKKEILTQLNKASLFEIFLHTKYVGQKRFSLEGAETLIPIMHEMIEVGAQSGMQECVICMAHRGRLNVLVNILNKSYSDVFGEFEGFYDPTLTEGSGDVKYHKGYSADIETLGGARVHISLSSNPSHLEAVAPVVAGKTRAKQVQRGDKNKNEVVPLIIHGDAALAGQGVVYECLQMYTLDGYAVGGTLHIVINNQVGFTTLPQEGRSTPYCTGVALGFSSPIFHVNTEDPEACVFVAALAMKLRQTFGFDVFIDMQGYRKHGHNEGDEPFFTQPLESQLIRSKKTLREHYRDTLLSQSAIEAKVTEELEEGFKLALHSALEEVKISQEFSYDEAFKGVWEDFHKAESIELFQQFQTHVEADQLKALVVQCARVPANFHMHPKVEKIFSERIETLEKSIDWATAEFLAMGSILADGIFIRLAGQDSKRGTFSQRHAVWVDQTNGEQYYPLAHVSKTQGRFDVINSPLCEFAALGFEFGYSLAYPQGLVIWEAQYGDFANGAQIVIDQFISSSERKWARSSGLTMLLPHGFEGQGPEHSSARIERYLQLCGDDNMQVTYPTTPAQYFHLLRRQAIRPIRKPLIIFTPKGLLRHPKCLSALDDFTSSSFREFIEEPGKKENATKLLFCSGKIYYDLLEYREKKKREEIALIRFEQLYPISEKSLIALISEYRKATEFVWVQEEPQNMGAWNYLNPILQKVVPVGTSIECVARKPSAATATGSPAIHKKEFQQLMNRACDGR